MTSIKGHILTPTGFVLGELHINAEGRVAQVTGQPVSEARVFDSALPIVLPGFIDLHVHGGGGRDVMDGGNAIATVAGQHAQHGTTSLLGTTMTAPMEDLELAFAGLAAACANRAPRSARVLGVHLEGPYINDEKLGAQPDFARPVQAAELKHLNDLAPIRLITLAPEVPGNMDVIESLVQAGYRVQIGHTLASYDEAVQAMGKGANGFTHLFNAMTGLHHRKPGAVGAALAHAQYAEIIPDLVHVHPGAIRVALRAIPHLYCVTDSTAAAGMPDGEYQLGRQTVTKCMGGVRLADGTLAGSTLTMDQALRNLVHSMGLGLVDASRRVSTNAANFVGATDRGRLQAGAWADLVLLNRDLNITDVYIEGESVEHAHAV
ncbi:MAG: N-acetylglucosamine-6-phosphate deacetylase [Rhodoferax sp.]|nr:N-acetylglucosamine-6-phosphate deacetylase [Rhodoferax sp.]